MAARGCFAVKERHPASGARGINGWFSRLFVARNFPATTGLILLCAVLLWPCGSLSAQSSEPQAPQEGETQKSKKTYPVRTGGVTYTRTEESERRQTTGGEVETQRVRMPSYPGDRRLLLEREIRTKKLPDGTVEKEYVLRNPDASGRLVPIEIIREKVKKNGDSTTLERETLKPGITGHWTPIQRERVTEAGPEENRQSIREVREPSMAGGWRIVERQVTAEKASKDGKESHSVRQLPGTYGRLTDYEVRQERTTILPGKEIREVTLRRRDFQDTHQPRFYLVERTVAEESRSAEGGVAVKSTTESDFLAGGATRNVAPGPPQVVEERVEQESPAQDGSVRKVVSVRQRGVVDPQMRPSYQVVQETDQDGHVRQVFIPGR